MNLEDQIRRSAGRQAGRYQQASTLGVRVEQRRHQRAARRAAAVGVAGALLLGAGALAVVSQIDNRGEITPAAPNATIAPSTAAVTTVAPPTTTAAPRPTATTAPSAAATQAPTPPTTAPLHPSTPVAYAGADGSVWPFGEFSDVPQLGHEAVRGTGCGSTATDAIAEVVPDGLWAGFVAGHTDSAVSIDLLCVYPVASASALPNPSSNVVLDQPGYVIVNNSTRTRTMPMDAAIALRLGVRDAAGRCVDGTPTTQWADIPADRQVWLRIHNGAVTWVFANCA